MPSVFKYNGNEIIDSSGNITASSVKNALNASGDAPVYACRAWVSFDGTKDTSGASSTANTNRLIRASGNVASVLRNGTGNYTVNFTTEMPDINFNTVGSTIGTQHSSYATFVCGQNTANTISTVSVQVRNHSGAQYDHDVVNVAIFR